MDTVAFHLYDLRKTGYIERDEVPSLPCKLDFTMDHYLLDNHPSFSYKFFLLTLFFFLCGWNFQVKEMVVALLSESDMKLSEEVIETILDKVERLSFFIK
jgi:serine/threonine-protein phosphatase 2B regulatory subunit